MKTKTAFIVLIGIISVFYAPELKAQKTAVHWYLPTMSLDDASRLKGYDLIMIDPEVIFNDRASLDALRSDNRQIKIYCYFNAVEWFNPMFPDKPWSSNIVTFLDKHEEWFLHGSDGKRLSFWTGMQTMNCRVDCPKVPVYAGKSNLSYLEFITGRFIDDILKEYPFDGVLMDNLWDKINWLGYYGVNRSGIDYSPLENGNSPMLNLYWIKGMSDCLDEIKKFGGSDFKIIGNPGHLEYTRQCFGKMFENFPEIYLNEKDTIYEAWYENLNNAAAFPNGACIFNARKDNYFFTLCSAMLLDNIYFSYLQNTPYENKYRLNLGEPLASAQSNQEGIISRVYEQGIVYVDPLSRKARIVYKNGRDREE